MGAGPSTIHQSSVGVTGSYDDRSGAVRGVASPPITREATIPPGSVRRGSRFQEVARRLTDPGPLLADLSGGLFRPSPILTLSATRAEGRVES